MTGRRSCTTEQSDGRRGSVNGRHPEASRQRRRDVRDRIQQSLRRLRAGRAISTRRKVRRSAKHSWRRRREVACEPPRRSLAPDRAACVPLVVMLAGSAPLPAQAPAAGGSSAGGHHALRAWSEGRAGLSDSPEEHRDDRQHVPPGARAAARPAAVRTRRGSRGHVAWTEFPVAARTAGQAEHRSTFHR